MLFMSRFSMSEQCLTCKNKISLLLAAMLDDWNMSYVMAANNKMHLDTGNVIISAKPGMNNIKLFRLHVSRDFSLKI